MKNCNVVLIISADDENLKKSLRHNFSMENCKRPVSRPRFRQKPI
jgi:hypothetical protein